MLISAIAALALFAAPETTQAGETAAAEKPAKSAKAEDKGPAKTCYTTTPSGSRMPRKVCVTKAVERSKDDAKVESSKPD